MLDPFGIRKIYHTKSNGQEFFMDHKNIEELEGEERVQNWKGKNLRPGREDEANTFWESDGGSNGQFRLEVWSPKFEDMEKRRKARWRNVEITVYCRVVKRPEINEGRSGYAWQLYGRGGHHTERRPCEGGTLKARWWNKNGPNSVVKEICHPAFTSNEAITRNNIEDQSDYGNNRWYGSKLVIYNIKDGNKTLTKQELYTDHDENDSDMNLVIQNNWKKVTEFTDRGGWHAGENKFEQFGGGCGRKRDEILTKPGRDSRPGSPNFNRNLIALRWDNQTVRFNFLSAREIDPGRSVAG